MQQRTPSVTAGTVAAHRAIASERPVEQRICFDPLARAFLSTRMKVIGESAVPESMALWMYGWMLPGFHTYFAVRTRHLDERLRAAINAGIGQLVILGAGYDSRAYRFDELRSTVKVFEVDHPATQKDKLAKLTTIFGAVPAHVTYVPVDFAKQTLTQRLQEQGYRSDLRTLFIWEGVSYYLPAAAVDETLQFVSRNSSRGSSIVFDYTRPSVVAGTAPEREAKTWRQAVKGFGEPLLFGIASGDIEQYLKSRGFSHVSNATRDVLRDLYLKGSNQGRYLSPVFSIVQAGI